PGHYIINAHRGTISIKQGLVVGSGDETRNIVVSSANAAVKANPEAAKAANPPVTASGPSAKFTIGMIPNSGRGFITEPIDWQIFTYSKGTTENGQLVAHKSLSSATFTLPAGSYVVRASYKGTQSDL